MPVEIEAKFIFSCKKEQEFLAELENVLLRSDFQLIEEQVLHLRDVYFDTPDYTLLRHSGGLRLREYQTGPVQLALKEELKIPQASAGLFQRLEIEGDANATLLHKIFRESHLLSRPDEDTLDTFDENSIINKETLQESGLTESAILINRRVEYKLLTPRQAVLSLAVDQVSCTVQSRNGRFCELEIEVIKGSAEDIRELTDFLLAELTLDLEFSVVNKYRRAFDITNSFADLEKVWEIETFKTWQKQLSKIRAKICKLLPEAIQFKHSETLHQARVSLRQFLTVLYVLKNSPSSGSSDRKAYESLYKHTGKIQSLLGKVRDLDVYLERLFHQYPPDPGIASYLIELVRKERDGARLKCLLRLTNERIVKWADESKNFIQKHLEPLVIKTDIAGSMHLLRQEFQEAFVQFEQCRRSYGPFHPDTIKSLHSIRIQAKKLRYSYTYLDFAMEYPAKNKIKKYEKIQDQLGDLNDLFNFENLLIQLGNIYGNLLSESFQKYRREIHDKLTMQLQFAINSLEEYNNFEVPHASSGGQHASDRVEINELTIIKGIGGKTRDYLLSQGISDLKQLSEMSENALKLLDTTEFRISTRAIREGWVLQARHLLSRHQQQI